MKIAVIHQAQTDQWKGSSHPDAPRCTADSMAAEDLTPCTDSIAGRPESQITIKTEVRPTGKKLSVAAKLCDIFQCFLDVHRGSARNIRGASNRAEGHHLTND